VINAGSLIRFSAIDKINTAVNFGSFTKSGDTGLNATTENLFAYIGSDINTPTTFLAAISNGNYGSGTGSALISSLVGTGLTVGVNATQLTASSDFAEYTGLRSGLTSFSDYKSLIASNANWNIQGTVDASNTVPNITAFTIAAIPEPETYAMFLAGLGLMAFVSRRKQ